jgi:hypothetical protein
MYCEIHPQVLVELDHALIVDGRVADAGHDIPLLQRIRRIGAVGTVHHHALHRLIELQIVAQRRILERLQSSYIAGLPS